MKIYNNLIKRILSGVTGLVLAATPISFVKAEKVTISGQNGQKIVVDLPENSYLKVKNDGTYEIIFEEEANENEYISNQTSIETIKETTQERVDVPMSFEEFEGILENSNKALSNAIDFNIYPLYRYMTTEAYSDLDMQRDMKCLVYYTNAEYIKGTDLEKELVANAYVNQYNFYNDPNAMTNTYSAYNLINQIADYNHRVIASLKCNNNGEIVSREIEDNGIENLIDVSVFCRDEHDRKVLHEQYLNLKVLAKALVSGDEQAILEALELNFRSLTTLNSDVTNSNNASVSVGANWLNTVSNGTTFITWMETYLDNKYTRKELGKYFDARYLNLNQWFINGEYDALLNPNSNASIPAIEYDLIEDVMLKNILEYDSTMHYYVYHTANIALTNLLGEQIECSKTKTK